MRWCHLSLRVCCRFSYCKNKTKHFSHQVFIRKGKIREQVICLRQQRAQHIYLWKSGHFYTFKGQGLNLLHLFSWPAWTPWQLALPPESLQYPVVCGSRVRLSSCGHFSLQLWREAGPLEQALSTVLGLGLWGKKQFCPVCKSSELASLPALSFLWEGFLALPILATWMALWFHVCCSESGHTLQMWSEQLKTAGQTSPTIQMPYLCSCYFYSCYLFFFLSVVSHVGSHRVGGTPGPSDCFAWMLLKRVLPKLKITDTEGWMWSWRSAKATSHICRRRPLPQIPGQNVWTERRRFTLSTLDFIFDPQFHSSKNGSWFCKKNHNYSMSILINTSW